MQISLQSENHAPLLAKIESLKSIILKLFNMLPYPLHFKLHSHFILFKYNHHKFHKKLLFLFMGYLNCNGKSILNMFEWIILSINNLFLINLFH